MTRVIETVEFPGPEGRLEGLWGDPGRDRAPAVLCHPHPAFRGSMHSKVIHTLYRVLDAAGHPTLRFNFRGVGRSEGTPSGRDSEVSDVAAAAAYARARTAARSAPPLWLGGFSFGAWVGLRWAADDGGVGRAIALGIPVNRHGFDFLDGPPAPLLIVQGAEDAYGSREGVLALGERLAARGDVSIKFVPEADHFFTGHIAELAHVLREGLGLAKEAS